MMLLRCLFLGLVSLALSACASARVSSRSPDHSFQFGQDSLAYANELVWEYTYDPVSGKTTTHHREPKPEYTLHCFVVARSVRQFFDHARFDPALAKADGTTYR